MWAMPQNGIFMKMGDHIWIAAQNGLYLVHKENGVVAQFGANA
jgi:hypothetical protein